MRRALGVSVLPLVLGWALPAHAQERVANPHGQLNAECASCHGAEGWRPAQISRGFDHGKSGFALSGAHASTACRACHISLEFGQVATNCAGCHRDVHRGELGATCSQCHSTRSFLDRGPMVQAHRATRFPLAGSHLTVDCEACHTPSPQGHLTFVNRATECVACHQPEYQQVQNPSHTALAFPTDCTQCHTSTVWPQVRFNHAGTSFPLTGAHRAVSCPACHGDAVYRGKNEACVACHNADYVATSDPGHVVAQFPTDCAACHNTTGWAPATFDHDGPYFPIYSGKHRGRWSSCATCHTTPANFQQFTCLTCHEHSQTEMDDKHRGRSGYRYDSQACLSCHPRGDS